jgi:hypothetical protein
MNKSHCTVGYRHFGTSQLILFAEAIENGIYGNPISFPAPILSQPAFGLLKTKFITAKTDYDTFGAVKRTDLTTAQTALVDGIDLQVDYVNQVANGDESLIILAGFVPSSTVSQNNIPITAINTFTAKRTEVMGEIAVEIPTINGHGTVDYVCVCAEANPLTLPAFTNGQIVTTTADIKIRIDVNKSRKKKFTGLTPGVMYHFYVTAVNTVSVAPISGVRSVMAA